jgi:hypothetical protein
MQLENFIDISEIKKSRSAPWRFTDNTEISCSENFKINNGLMKGNILEEIEADSKALEDSGECDLSDMNDREIFYSTLEFIINNCEEFIDHEEQFGLSRFGDAYIEMAKNIQEGEFIIKNLLCFDEADLIDLIFSTNSVLCRVHENPDYE